MDNATYIDRAKLDAAFKALRRAGYIARQSYKCCSNCAGAQIATDVAAMSEAKRSAVRGVVTYNRQNGTALDCKGGILYIGYGPVHCDGVGTIGDDTKTVGDALATALRDAGLRVVWNGDPIERIAVTV